MTERSRAAPLAFLRETAQEVLKFAVGAVLFGPALLGLSTPFVNWFFHGDFTGITAYQLWITGEDWFYAGTEKVVYVADPSMFYGQRRIMEFLLNENIIWLGIIWPVVLFGSLMVLAVALSMPLEGLRNWFHRLRNGKDDYPH